MLAIRLQRGGRSGYPTYRIVVQEANRHPLSGRIVAQVGSFNPHTKETVLNKELAEKYLSNGAQPSSRVIRIFKAQKIALPSWVKEPTQKTGVARNPAKLRKNQPKEEAPAPAEEPAEAPVEAEAAPVETPAEEPAPEAAPETPAE